MDKPWSFKTGWYWQSSTVSWNRTIMQKPELWVK